MALHSLAPPWISCGPSTMAASLRPPDPWAASAALLGEGARSVIVGGFAVVANRHVRATKDTGFLIPDDPDNDARCLRALERLGATLVRDGGTVTLNDVSRDHIRVDSTAGIIDLIREGAPPLDFDSVVAAAHVVASPAGDVLIAGLVSLVAMKRLARRPQDLADLDALAAIHGPLPIVSVPGVDDV